MAIILSCNLKICNLDKSYKRDLSGKILAQSLGCVKRHVNLIAGLSSCWYNDTDTKMQESFQKERIPYEKSNFADDSGPN